MVLDNVEQLPACGAVGARWRELAPSSRFLVTSTMSLGMRGEEVRILGPLPTGPRSRAGAGRDARERASPAPVRLTRHPVFRQPPDAGSSRASDRPPSRREVRCVVDTKPPHSVLSPEAVLYLGDAFEVLDCLPADSVHAVVTDAPYRNLEYAADQQAKLRGGRGGVWRIPPTLDGRPRRPVPRFTVLSEADRSKMEEFFGALARALLRPLVPGAHVLIASNPLLSEHVFLPFVRNGFEKRGMVIREVRTLRGGDRRGIPGLVGDAAFGS